MIRIAQYLAFALGAALISPVPDEVLDQAVLAEVVVIGEIHDNPRHHQTQTSIIQAIDPMAIVFEMLSEEQATLATPDIRTDLAALEKALDWARSGWPDFELYAPLFSVVPEAKIYGAALPRGEARGAMQEGVAQSFGEDAEVFGLTAPLPADQQAEREELQYDAHCEALPRHLLPDMVALQRLRDAMLARAVLRALNEVGPPVAVITGNGHARRDWGVPAILEMLASDANIYVIGQGEDGHIPSGGFDIVLDAPSRPRPDPCEAFR